MKEQPSTTEYVNQNLSQRDFCSQDLTEARFINCTLEATSFKDANLTGATFNHCTGHGVMFSSALMRHVQIDNCKFLDSQFENANIFDAVINNLDVRGSVLQGCRFNKSKIDGMDVALCNLNMTSFLDTQILSLNYMPTLPMPFMRGIHPLKPGHLRHNHIFMNGNQHLEFTGFCNKEAVKERLFTSIENRRRWVRPVGIAVLWGFGVISDFGQSFTRWLLFVTLIILFFTALLTLHFDVPLITALDESLRSFFGFDLEPTSNAIFLTEAITGYFMLGVLISLLTSKIQLH